MHTIGVATRNVACHAAKRRQEYAAMSSLIIPPLTGGMFGLGSPGDGLTIVLAASGNCGITTQ